MGLLLFHGTHFKGRGSRAQNTVPPQLGISQGTMLLSPTTILVGDRCQKGTLGGGQKEGVCAHEYNRGEMGPVQEDWIKETVGAASGRHNTQRKPERRQGPRGVVNHGAGQSRAGMMEAP